MARPATMSPDLRTVLTQGATSRQLAQMFQMDQVTVDRRLAAVRPVGERDGRHIWRVKDAAPTLVPLPTDAVDRVLRMGHMDLPPMLRKEYWQGQAQQLKVLEQEGHIWRTEAVQRYVGEAFREVRMEIKLLQDGLERNTELTERQRNLLSNAIDGCLTGIRDRLIEFFKDVHGERDGQSAIGLLDPPEEDPAAGL